MSESDPQVADHTHERLNTQRGQHTRPSPKQEEPHGRSAWPGTPQNHPQRPPIHEPDLADDLQHESCPPEVNHLSAAPPARWCAQIAA